MEVKNQAMDQLLVNTAAQTQPNSGAAKQKEQDTPTFDSMVNKRRSVSEKGEVKAEKTQKPGRELKTDASNGETQDAEVQLADGQLALAAMMLQMQGDVRVEQTPEEETETVPEIAVQTILAPQAQETVETELMPAAQTEVEQAAPVQEEEAPVQQTPETQKTEAPVQERETEAPVETHTERTPEERTVDKPADEKPLEPAHEETRTEKEPEAPRAARNEIRVQREETEETEETDAAQEMQSAPLFRNVEAPVVKVAEASRPIPLEAEDGAEQLGKELNDVMINSADANRIEVTLTPENLGRLTVEITRNENGNLSIVLHTASERTASLLEKNVHNLQNALTTENRSSVEVQIRPAEESERRQFLNPDGRNDQNQRQQQQQQHGRHARQSAEDFLQQLRLGLVDSEEA